MGPLAQSNSTSPELRTDHATNGPAVLFNSLLDVGQNGPKEQLCEGPQLGQASSPPSVKRGTSCPLSGNQQEEIQTEEETSSLAFGRQQSLSQIAEDSMQSSDPRSPCQLAASPHQADHVPGINIPVDLNDATCRKRRRR